VKRLVGSALLLLPLALGGCDALSAIIPISKADVATRQAGMWQKTVISVQKYNNALFRDKKTGKALSTDDARDKPEADVTLEAGDFEELAYRAGRMRYAYYAREAGAQPFVVERAIEEKDFEALDDAIWKDKFFGMPEKNWSDKRFPMYFVQYDQSGKGWHASFTPDLTKLLKSGPILNKYMQDLSGATKMSPGTKQYAYYLTADKGTLTVSISTLTGSNGGDADETPWKFKSASYDLGKGSQAATVGSDGTSFTLPTPSGDGGFQLMALKVTAEGDPGTWDTLIPVRTSK
jgi:hypothetical protein